MKLYQIKSRRDGSVIFEREAESMKACVEAAVRENVSLAWANLMGENLEGANLQRAYLMYANLKRANLMDSNFRGAYLMSADLRRANLSRSDLRGANILTAGFRGAILDGIIVGGRMTTPEEAVANLDRVRGLILGSESRLMMSSWHGTNNWRSRSAEEETACGTTHCLAGWLQVLSTDQQVRGMHPQIAGAILAPVAQKMFFSRKRDVIAWLRDREYAAA